MTLSTNNFSRTLNELNTTFTVKVYEDLNIKDCRRYAGRDNCLYYVEVINNEGVLLTKAYVTSDNVPVFVFVDVPMNLNAQKTSAIDLIWNACEKMSK